jgi:hypothetical protein
MAGSCRGIARLSNGPVVTWRPAQVALVSAQGIGVAAIATAAFTSQDRSVL